MSNHASDAIWLVGRVLMSAIFLMSGVMKILHWAPTQQSMASEGMAATPFFLLGAIVLEIGGGLGLLLGYKARWAGLALALFLIPTTLIFHDFWTYQGQAMENQMQHFMKNLTIMGGLLTIGAVGAGAYSLDALEARGGFSRWGAPRPISR